MGNAYLAIDIGASSGRHILGTIKQGRIVLEEIYRFPNGMREKDNHLCWDLNYLFQQILIGLQKCGELGKLPTSLAIDTWGVDFVLLNKDDRVLGDTVAYRDDRTKGMDKVIRQLIAESKLYERTGIQKQLFNTVYQLMALGQTERDLIDQAERFLMIPEYLNFLLTGVKLNEYTNATTTGLVNASRKTWDRELIDMLGFKQSLFVELNLPKTSVGYLRPEIVQKVGFDCEVVLPPTHDTAAAVLAVPMFEDNSVYISSGTWSLIGVEKMEPDCSEESRQGNFTNEGGFDYRYRYLKNIMGLWIIQSVKKELGDRYSYNELCALAAQEELHSIIDVNDPSFLAPKSMNLAIRDFCKSQGQTVPTTAGAIAACVYHSLAQSYREALQELERLMGTGITAIHIVGGGCQDRYLNELTAKYTGKQVMAGPVEATALGNILSQALKAGEFSTVHEARRAVMSSFSIEKW